MTDSRIEKTNEYLASLSEEEINLRNEEQLKQDDADFQKLKDYLGKGMCSYCEHPLSHFSEKKPCFHWLLNPKGFKKKHFPLLYSEKAFHQLEVYLRWVANSDTPMKNINDIVEERSSSKLIEITIKYKNLEWSFVCSKGDMEGHKDRHEGTMPHYHFQMKVDGNVMINYNGFHIPFNDYDEFCFAVKRGEFNKIRGQHIHGAGMQAFFDNFTPEELIDMMTKSDDEETASFNVGILMRADEGHTISGDQLAELFRERQRTGESMAKLARKLENVSIEAHISAGSGVPEIARRTEHRRKKEN